LAAGIFIPEILPQPGFRLPKILVFIFLAAKNLRFKIFVPIIFPSKNFRFKKIAAIKISN